MSIGFKSYHPVTQLVFFIFVFAFSLVSTNPLSLAVCFLCGAIYALKIQKKKAAVYILKFILPLMLLITVFNGIFAHYGVTVIFTAKSGNNFTLEALVCGFVNSAKIACMLLWLECFNEILTSDEIIFLFGRISPKTALMISTVLRFIPLIRSQSEQISNAQKGLGNSPDACTFIGKIKNAARRLSILVSWTLERGIDSSDSMRARGYGLHGRNPYNPYIFAVRDAAVLALCAAGIITMIFSTEKLSATYNPVINIPAADILSVTATVLFAVLMLTPLIIDLREEKKWSISK